MHCMLGTLDVYIVVLYWDFIHYFFRFEHDIMYMRNYVSMRDIVYQTCISMTCVCVMNEVFVLPTMYYTKRSTVGDRPDCSANGETHSATCMAKCCAHHMAVGNLLVSNIHGSAWQINLLNNYSYADCIGMPLTMNHSHQTNVDNVVIS